MVFIKGYGLMRRMERVVRQRTHVYKGRAKLVRRKLQTPKQEAACARFNRPGNLFRLRSQFRRAPYALEG